MNNYKSLRNLPVLAGLCTMTEAMHPGLSVNQCVARLKRLHYAFKRLQHILMARLTAEPIYELKSAFSLHAHLCAEQVTALRKQVGEMREPPLGLEAIPDAALEVFFDEILSAPGTEELVAGLYQKAFPALKTAVTRYLGETNPLVDQPIVRLGRIMHMDLDDILTCWSRVLMGWESWRAQGLTSHRNWWPDLYSEACALWKTEPDPDVLAFSTSYQSVRADLKNISASA